MLYVGVDQHKKYSYFSVINEKDEMVCQKKIESEYEAIEDLLSDLGDEELSIALEAGPSWYWLYDFLETKANQMTLVNPKKVKAIASAKLKNDKMDSETLAKLLKGDLLPEAYVPTSEERHFRELVRFRVYLVRIKTKAKNRCHSILAKLGIKHPYSDLFGKSGLVFLDELADSLGFPFGDEIKALVRLIGFLESEIKNLTKTIDALSVESPSVCRIAKISGFSHYSALLVVSEIGDVFRFKNAKKLFSYAGIIPRERSSGEKIRRGPITKEGSAWLRWVLVEAAQRQEFYQSSPFYHDFKRIAAKKGRNIAKVAIARKLLKKIYEILKDEGLKNREDWGGLRFNHGRV